VTVAILLGELCLDTLNLGAELGMELFGEFIVMCRFIIREVVYLQGIEAILLVFEELRRKFYS
jgi:hypothetical protein